MARKPRTIDDIARLAGVSKTAVSRVLNHKPDVDSETRERILRIVEQESFIPRVTTSDPTRQHLIGVLVPSFTWPLIPDIMRGIAEIIAKTTYELVLYSINDVLREDDHRDIIDHILATKLSAGILAIHPGRASRHVTRLHKYGLPVVIIDDQELPPALPWVGTDNTHGALLATRHLIQLGHQRIAHIQGPLRYLCARERYQGYCQALEEAHLPLCPELVLEGDFTPTGGHSAASHLFALPPDRRPTAIFASSDQTAYGVLSAAEEHGLTIPKDVALVGFDDISSAAQIRPSLTTVRQPFHEMGQYGIELLLSLLDKSYVPSSSFNTYTNTSSTNGTSPSLNGGDPIRIQLATSLVVRASCGAPSPFPIPISSS